MSCWRRLLGVLWTALRSNQSILKEISPEYSLQGLMLKLKLQYFGHLMRRAESWEKTWWWEILKAGGEGDDREWNGWMASLTQWTGTWVNSQRWWWTGKPGMLQLMGSQSQTWLRDWTTTTTLSLKQYVVKCSLIIRNHIVESIILTMWWYTITLKDLHILESDYMKWLKTPFCNSDSTLDKFEKKYKDHEGTYIIFKRTKSEFLKRKKE